MEIWTRIEVLRYTSIRYTFLWTPTAFISSHNIGTISCNLPFITISYIFIFIIYLIFLFWNLDTLISFYLNVNHIRIEKCFIGTDCLSLGHTFTSLMVFIAWSVFRYKVVYFKLTLSQRRRKLDQLCISIFDLKSLEIERYTHTYNIYVYTWCLL